MLGSTRFVAALFQENPVIVDIIGDDIKKTILPIEQEVKDESIKQLRIKATVLHAKSKPFDINQ